MEKRFSEAAVVEIIVDKLYFYDKQKHKYAFVVLIIKSNLNVSFLKYELCTSLKRIEYNFSHIIEHLGLFA